MHIGNITNSNLFVNSKLSKSTLEHLSSLEFNKSMFESRFQFKSLLHKDHYIQTTTKDISYFESFGFKLKSHSHFYEQSLNLFKQYFREEDYIYEHWNKYVSKPYLSMEREKDGFIEEISFYLKSIEEDVLRIASKAKYYPSGKFLRDNSNSAFIFSKYYAFENKVPFYSLKFNTKNVTVSAHYIQNLINNEKHKKKKFNVKFLDVNVLNIHKSSTGQITDILFDFFSKRVLFSDIKNIFPELELSDLKNNGFIDLLNILNEDQIKMLRLIYF